MTGETLSGHRVAAASVLAIGGSAVAAATWVSGDHGLAFGIVGFYVVATLAAYRWSGGSGDLAAIARVGGDERQRAIDRDATAFAGLAMTLAAIVGAVVGIARTSNPGAYGIMCVVGGLAYTVSAVAIRRRR